METNRIYFWPDGTEHTISYQAHLNSLITPMDRFIQRLLFVVKRCYFLFLHFKRIEVTKELDGRGDFKYVSKLAFPAKLIAENIGDIEPITGSRLVRSKKQLHGNIKR